jgi:hypothetical protein
MLRRQIDNALQRNIFMKMKFFLLLIILNHHLVAMSPKFKHYIGLSQLLGLYGRNTMFTCSTPLFKDLCVQASKAQHLNQKRLQNVIARIAKTEPAGYSWPPESPSKCIAEFRLKGKDVRDLLRYIPWDGTIQEKVPQRYPVWINGKEIKLSFIKNSIPILKMDDSWHFAYKVTSGEYKVTRIESHDYELDASTSAEFEKLMGKNSTE